MGLKFIRMLKVDGFGEVEAWSSGRAGKDSPTSFYLKHNGRWITAFERRRRKWPILPIMQLIFENVYGTEDKIAQLLCCENPFLKLIPKDKSIMLVSIPIQYGAKK